MTRQRGRLVVAADEIGWNSNLSKRYWIKCDFKSTQYLYIYQMWTRRREYFLLINRYNENNLIYLIKKFKIVLCCWFVGCSFGSKFFSMCRINQFNSKKIFFFVDRVNNHREQDLPKALLRVLGENFGWVDKSRFIR